MEAAFDTHRYVKSLTANGFTEKQAEVLANERVALLNSNLATEADIQSVNKRIEALRSDTERYIEKLRSDTERYIAKLRSDTEKLHSDTAARIAELNADLQRWTVTVVLTVAGVVVAAGGVVVALLRLL